MPKRDRVDKIVDEDSVGVDSFRAYKASGDDHTKIVNGEKEIESFHLYKEEDDNHDETNKGRKS
jgi:hypothetical protein